MRLNRHYGVGIEWTDALEEDFAQDLQDQTIFEIIPENFFEGSGDGFLKFLGKAGIPVLIHGVELSIGTDEPLKQSHFDKWRRVMDQVNVVALSEHLSMTEAGGVEIGQLTPLPWTLKSLDVVCRKIEQVQSQIQLPFSIENVTNRFQIPGTELTETEFINLITSRTGCGLLLDCNNIHTNATNFKYDPLQWIDEINLNTVDTIHLAGGFYDEEGTLIDSHDNTVPEPVWRLFEYVCQQITPPATIVERTGNWIGYAPLKSEVQRAREMIQATSHSRPSLQTQTALGGLR